MLNRLFTQRKKTPIVIQMETIECGAAALSMILSYYGRYVSLEELRVRCGVSRSGVNAYNMLEAAKYYGLTGEGYEISYDHIKEVDCPAILYWNYSHFVVLEGWGRKGFYINDPASGPRLVNPEDFKNSLSGVALILKPSNKFVKGGQPFNLWKRLGQKMWPFRRYLIYLLLVEFVLIFLGLTVPLFFQVFIDKILPNFNISWKFTFFAMFSCAAFFVGVMTWRREKFLNLLRVVVSNTLSSQFLWHILHLPVSFFTQRYGGEIVQRTLLNNEIAESVMGTFLISLINVSLILFYLAVIATYSVGIALIGLAAGLFNFCLLIYVSRARTSAYANFKQKEAKAIGFSLDALSYIETIKTNNAEPSFFSKISGLYTQNVNELQKFAKKDAWLSTLSSFSDSMSQMLLLAIGFWYVLEGFFTVGMFIGLQILLSLFLRPFKQLVNFGALIQELRIKVNRVDDVLQNPMDPIFTKVQTYVSPEKLQGKLELKDVTFGYSPLDEPVVKECSLSINKGEWVALVGSVASGKSTLARIACQLYKPWSGQVLYDDIPAEDFSPKDLKKYLAVVDQDIVLFAGSVKDNLSLWDETITDEQMVQASKDACIHEDILQRPYGYDAKLSEGGTNFSQGQRQRLEISRTLVHNPSLLIMDEATNAVEEALETEIIKRLRRRTMSCIMISHRLNAIKMCDRIIVLDKGKIVQEGTHDELAATPGIYQNLIGGSVIG